MSSSVLSLPLSSSLILSSPHLMKKSSSNIIPIDLAFSESKWINTPFLYAKLGSTFSRLQQTLMFRVCSSLQDYIAKAITANSVEMM